MCQFSAVILMMKLFDLCAPFERFPELVACRLSMEIQGAFWVELEHAGAGTLPRKESSWQLHGKSPSSRGQKTPC